MVTIGSLVIIDNVLDLELLEVIGSAVDLLLSPERVSVDTELLDKYEDVTEDLLNDVDISEVDIADEFLMVKLGVTISY